MSQLNGLFSLRTPKDLVEKLEADFNRLRGAKPASVDAQYAAFDFFITAEHLPDWLSRSTGGSLSSHRAYPEAPLVSHIANGAKHFRVDTTRHTTARHTRSTSGAFQANAFQQPAFQTSRLVVDLEDGTTIDVLDFAGRVLDYWRRDAIP
jgi:hypothetical protein